MSTDSAGDATPTQRLANSDLRSASSNGGTADPPWAPNIWNRNPVEAFELLRDRVCCALDEVCELHRLALASPIGQSVADVGFEHHDPLFQAVEEGQSLWFDTPAHRFLERCEGPVYLDHQFPAGPGNRASGSCYHDLALALGVTLWRLIHERQPALDFVRSLRFYTAAGDRVNQHLAGLIPLVRCECQDAIRRWRAETMPVEPSVTVPFTAGPPSTPRPKSGDKKSNQPAVDGPTMAKALITEALVNEGKLKDGTKLTAKLLVQKLRDAGVNETRPGVYAKKEYSEVRTLGRRLELFKVQKQKGAQREAIKKGSKDKHTGQVETADHRELPPDQIIR